MISDETKKVHVDLMLKDNKEKLRKIEHLVKKLKRVGQNNASGEPLCMDEESGLNQLMEL